MIIRSQLSNFKAEISILWNQYLCPAGQSAIPKEDFIFRLFNISKEIGLSQANGNGQLLKKSEMYLLFSKSNVSFEEFMALIMGRQKGGEDTDAV